MLIICLVIQRTVMFDTYQTHALEKHNKLRERHDNTPLMTLDRALCDTAVVSYKIFRS